MTLSGIIYTKTSKSPKKFPEVLESQDLKFE